jgi:hypothetical protein
VTATCATCHGFEGNAPTGAETPDFGPLTGTIGTASTRAVYTEAEEVHIIGAGFGSVGATAGWDFYTWAGTGTDGTEGPQGPGTTRGVGTASYYNGGLYCGSCHTPHGEFGQLVNSQWAVTSADQAGGANAVAVAARPWQNDTRIWWEDPTPNDAGGIPPNLDPGNPWKQVYLFFNGTAWTVCTGTGGSGTCEYAQVLDAENQLVSLYGYKLLTSSPNHQYPVRNDAGQYQQSDGTFGATPTVGLYSDAPFAGGTLARNAGSPNFLTHNTIGTLAADIGPVATSIDVNETVTGTAVPAVPFKLRVDEEILMVTARTAPGALDDGHLHGRRGGRAGGTEAGCRSWGPVYASGALLFDLCAGAPHTATTEVLLVPTLLVNEDATRSVAQTLGVPPSTSGNPGGLKPLASYTSSQRWPCPSTSRSGGGDDRDDGRAVADEREWDPVPVHDRARRGQERHARQRG